MRLHTLRRRSLRALALTTVAAVTAMVAPSPAMAVSADLQENLSTVVATQTPSFTPATPSVPRVESLLGRGAPLSTDPAARVLLGAEATGAASALVRVTLLEPATDTTVSTGASSPVLHVSEGSTGSAVALLTVDAGSVSLWGTHSAPLRIEPLAYFVGGESAPGSTIALADPVRRADTAVALGGTAVTSTPLWIGLTGEGGVPSTGVRSVYLTLQTDLAEADVLNLGDGQQLPLPAEPAVVTTIVTLDELGGITAALASANNSGALVADVQGWVSEAPVDALNTNLTGSYVSTTEHGDAKNLQVTAAKDPHHITLADHLDVDYALVLVSGTPAAPQPTTTLDWYSEFSGRATGSALDGTLGALPQLTLVAVDDGTANLGIRRGSAAVTLQPLGGFLGDAIVPPHGAEDANIQITSPLNRADVNISETGYFTLTGTVAAGANAIDRIEISSPSVGFIGFAELSYSDDDITWEFSAAAPDDGDFDYVASVFDRGDTDSAAASDRVTLTVNTPDADDTVVSPEVNVFNENAAALDFSVTSPTQILFAAQPSLSPGSLIVSGPIPSSAEGFLGRVAAINRTSEGWVVDTIEASLEEVFFQVDIQETVDFDYGMNEQGDLVQVTSLPDTMPVDELFEGSYAVASPEAPEDLGPESPIDSFVVEPDDGVDPGADELEHTQLLTGDAVDLELGADDYDPKYADDFELVCRAPGADTQEPTGDQIDENGAWAGDTSLAGPATSCDEAAFKGSINKTWSIGLDATLLIALENGKLNVTNQTKKDPWEVEQAQKHALNTRAALAIQAGGEVSVTLNIVFDVNFKFKWKVIPAGVNVNEFSVKVTTNLKAHASAKAFFDVKYRMNLKQQVAEVALPYVMFMVGPVPVAITNQLSASVGINVAFKAQVELPLIGVEREDQFGFSYSSHGGMTRIKNEPKTTYPNVAMSPLADATTVSLDGELSVGPEIALASRVYSFAGPEITLAARAGLAGSASAFGGDLRQIHAKVQVFVELGLTGEAKLKLIRWQILNITVFNLAWRTNLVTKEWDFRV